MTACFTASRTQRPSKICHFQTADVAQTPFLTTCLEIINTCRTRSIRITKCSWRFGYGTKSVI